MALDHLRYTRTHITEQLNHAKAELKRIRDGHYQYTDEARRNYHKADAERRVKYWLTKLDLLDRREGRR